MPAAPPVTLATLLARLGEEAAALDRSLPSFTCLQTASSDELLATKKNEAPKVLRHVTFTANVRIRRGADGQLAESAEFLTVDGKPFTGVVFRCRHTRREAFGRRWHTSCLPSNPATDIRSR